MRELIVTQFISLDGVMEAPGGEPGYRHTGWVGPYFSDALGAFRLEEQVGADVLLLGRVTYDSFHGAWPGRAGDPMADKINSMRKVVVSTTLGSSPWTDTSVIAGDVAAEVQGIKAEDGGPILVVGSRTLAHFLLAHGLVDTISLQVFPLILGSGARFYPEGEDRLDLTLQSSRAIDNGVILQSYSVD